MATSEHPYSTAASHEPTVVSVASDKLSWGAIIGGTVAALGLAFLLHAFGLALGLSSIDPQNPASARGSGIFTGIWGLVAALLAMFVGGYVAARGAGVLTRRSGALHGLVMWGLSVLTGLWLAGNVASGVLSGAADFGKAAVRAVGADDTGQMSGFTQRLGLTSGEVLVPLNQRLRAQGKPEVTPRQLEAATRDVVQRGVRDGRLDREQLVQAISTNTALSRADASDLAIRLEAKFSAARAQAVTGALKAADATGKALWGVFGAMFLGLVAAIAGATFGTPGGSRRRFKKVPIIEREPPPRPREEAYP